MIVAAAPALTDNYVLSEGPVWDQETQRLTWVEIERGAVLSAPLLDGAIGAVTRTDLGEYVGCAHPLGDGRTLVALTRALAIVEIDGSVTRGSELLPEGRRFNDGQIDPQGRLVVGSLNLGAVTADNVLLRLEPDGSVTSLDDDLRLSNGLGWSPDGAWFYSIDTESNVIHRRSYGEQVGPREAFIRLPERVWADGMTVDAQGRLWVAIWGGSGVRVFDADGNRLDDLGIAIDAPHSSSVAFIGAGLDIAVVTSASRDLSAEERALYPHAGGLFLASPGAVGLPATRWLEVPLL
ncbi:SMP-30/gluconolactonase/LRE family protein [Microbacteriaceae bacterium VKM Ac-2855]|nr:SMP-30/gluconolactonase/LRE family protein [Microbacteriaceae bacterium VKM Ac-2855]